MTNKDTAIGGAPKPINRNLLMAVLLSGAFVIILNQTLLNTALPAFMEDFGITANTAQWVTTIFMLINGIMIPVTAFLIEKFTTRALFLSALGLFSLGTIVAAVAPEFGVLLLGRALQAAGGGMIMPLMQTILFAIYPVHERGRAMGTFGLVISFAPALGPSLSGWIVDHYPWQVLFYLMLPIAILSMVFAYFVLDNVTERTFPTLDMLSIILSSLGFGGLLFGFSMAGEHGWASYMVMVPLLVGAVTLALFVWRQFRLEQPILEIRVLANSMFTLTTVLGMIVFVAMTGGMLILPVYMQQMTDYTAFESGLVLLPGALLMGLMSPVAGRIFDAVGAKWLSVVGFALVTGTSFMLAVLSTETSLTYLAITNAIRMLGVTLVMMPLTTAALNQLPKRLIPHGAAVNNTLRQVAGSVGTAVLVSVMVSAAKDPAIYGMEGQIHGANVTFIVAGIISLFGLIGSFFIKNSHGPDQEELIKAP